MRSQSALLQLLVGRFDGIEDAISQVPDWLSLMCSFIQDLQYSFKVSCQLTP
jgi:hypothetical protein